MVRCAVCPRKRYSRDAEGRLAGKALLLTGASGFVGKAVLGPDPPRAARHARSPCCCAATPQQRLRERGADQRARSRASTAARQGDQRRPRRRRPAGRRRHRRRHPLRRLASPSSSRSTRRSSSTARAPTRLLKARARRRQRPVLHPRLDRLRRGPAHRPRARAPVRHRADASRGWTSTPSSTPPRAWRARHRGRVAPAACTSTASSRRPSARSARPAARRPARAPRCCATRGSATSSPSAAASAPARSAGRDTYTLSQGDRRAHADRRRPAAADDRPPRDRRVRAAHAVPRLDGVAEGRRPDPARLRRRA